MVQNLKFTANVVLYTHLFHTLILLDIHMYQFLHFIKDNWLCWQSTLVFYSSCSVQT